LKKKIYIDTFYFQYAFSGIGTYISELVLGLNKYGSSKNEYVFSHQLNNKKNYINSNYKFLRLFFHLKYFIWKQILLPIKLMSYKPDLIICPDYVLPFFNFNTKQISVFHDAFFWDYPENYSKYWGYYFRYLIKTCLKDDTTIVTTSKTSKIKLSKFFSNDIKYVYQSYKPNKFYNKFKLEKFKVEKNKYILHIGSFDKRKNILTLVKAFEMLKKSDRKFDIKLILAGKQNVNGNSEVSNHVINFIKKNSLQKDVIITDYLSDSDITGLYSNALIYVFPSSDEGFGIPVLECFSNDLPIICSDIPIFREIGTDNAFYFELENVDELSSTMLKLINSKSEKDILIKKGRKRLTNFSRKAFVKDFENTIFQKIK
jgi:glycosyltransferase involved in cell wall biosynthesis